MTQKQVRVYAPATIANLGSGYDVIGVAIATPGDIVTAQRIKEPGLQFLLDTDNPATPSSSKMNVAAHVASLMIDEFKPPFGISLTLHKRMPIGSGLGSSAASSVGAVVAVNELLPKKLPRKDLLRFAVEGERMASGSPHADNAAPSLLGGVCLIRDYHPLDVVQVPVKKSPVWVVVHPHVLVRTAEARDILPRMIPMKDAVHQWGNVGGLTVGLITGDIDLIGKCVEDIIVEPVRASLIPSFYDVKRAALSKGAAGCSISGSGPSLFAIASSVKQAIAIGEAMKQAFKKFAEVDSEVYVSRINMQGAKLLSITEKERF